MTKWDSLLFKPNPKNPMCTDAFHVCSVIGLHSTGSKLGHHTMEDRNSEKLLLVPFKFFSTLVVILVNGKSVQFKIMDEDYARTHSCRNNWHR